MNANKKTATARFCVATEGDSHAEDIRGPSLYAPIVRDAACDVDRDAVETVLWLAQRLAEAESGARTEPGDREVVVCAPERFGAPASRRLVLTVLSERSRWCVLIGAVGVVCAHRLQVHRHLGDGSRLRRLLFGITSTRQPAR